MVEKREQGASGDEELWCWLTTAMVERRGRLRRIAQGKPYGCGYRTRRPVGLLRDSSVRADRAGSPQSTTRAYRFTFLWRPEELRQRTLIGGPDIIGFRNER